MYIYIYIHTCIQRERERERYTCRYVYMHSYTHHSSSRCASEPAVRGRVHLWGKTTIQNNNKKLQHIPIYIYIYTLIHIYIYIYMYLCIYIYIYLYTYTHMHVHIYIETITHNIIPNNKHTTINKHNNKVGCTSWISPHPITIITHI